MKDDGELARIEAACDIADVALAQVKERLAERPTEVEFAAELEFEMRRRGAAGAGVRDDRRERAEQRHAARPADGPASIGEGELVVVDFGAIVDGYRSDMTRTLCVGEPARDAASSSSTPSSPRSGPGCAAVRAGRAAARSTRPAASRSPGAGLRRGVPALDRPRCRPRDPRGPGGGRGLG